LEDAVGDALTLTKAATFKWKRRKYCTLFIGHLVSLDRKLVKRNIKYIYMYYKIYIIIFFIFE
jgi:hypothetical protein